MDFDNKTIVIIGLIIIGLGALFTGYEQLSLAIGSGLVGYLSKDAVTYIQTHTQEDEPDDI